MKKYTFAFQNRIDGDKRDKQEINILGKNKKMRQRCFAKYNKDMYMAAQNHHRSLYANFSTSIS